MIVLRKLRKLAYEARWRTINFHDDLKSGKWEETWPPYPRIMPKGVKILLCWLAAAGDVLKA